MGSQYTVYFFQKQLKFVIGNLIYRFGYSQGAKLAKACLFFCLLSRVGKRRISHSGVGPLRDGGQAMRVSLAACSLNDEKPGEGHVGTKARAPVWPLDCTTGVAEARFA